MKIRTKSMPSLTITACLRSLMNALIDWKTCSSQPRYLRGMTVVHPITTTHRTRHTTLDVYHSTAVIVAYLDIEQQTATEDNRWHRGMACRPIHGTT